MRALFVARAIRNICSKRVFSSPWYCHGSTRGKCHYETLGIEKTASVKEIRNAYLKKSKLCHPDLNPDDETLHAKFVVVNEAYSVLGDKAKKEEYDVGSTSRPSAFTYTREYGGPGRYRRREPDWVADEEMQKRMYEELHRYQSEFYMDRKVMEEQRKNNKWIVLKTLVLACAINFVMYTAFWQSYLYYSDMVEKRSMAIAATVERDQPKEMAYMEELKRKLKEKAANLSNK